MVLSLPSASGRAGRIIGQASEVAARCKRVARIRCDDVGNVVPLHRRGHGCKRGWSSSCTSKINFGGGHLPFADDDEREAIDRAATFPAVSGEGRPTTRYAPPPSSLRPLALQHCRGGAAVPSTRSMSSFADVLPSVPEFAQNWTIWGGSGYVLKAFHANGAGAPYWACFALTNVVVRTTLVPLVIHSAQTSANFAKVAPEVQFLISMFQQDMNRLKERNAEPRERFALIRATMQTLRGIYKLHNVNPLAPFKAPLMQLPFFWYFSVDIRKIVNGADPALAQKLTESGLLWIPDLTEPDPWYGLPVASGLLLYLNVEMAVGKKSLSGSTASKSNMALVLKDFFQSLAVFMPCFISQSPAGVQIYFATSMVFTLFQGMALRADSFRRLVGLPAMNAPISEGSIAKGFIDLKKKEREAIEARGDGEVLGKGVLAPGLEASFAGSTRPSTIAGSGGSGTVLSTTKGAAEAAVSGNSPFPTLRSPSLMVAPDQKKVRLDDDETKKDGVDQQPEKPEYMTQIPEAVMEAANRGERPPQPVEVVPIEKEKPELEAPVNVQRLISKRMKPKKRAAKKRKK